MTTAVLNFYEQLAAGRYGAIELKRIVGPNLLKGLAVSFTAHMLLIISPYIIQLIKGEEEIPPPPIRVVDISQLTKLKSMNDTPDAVKIALPKLAAPKASIPIAVAEDEVTLDAPLMLSQKELSSIISDPGGDELSSLKPGDQIVIREEQEEEGISDPGKFVPFEVAPQPLPDFSPLPAYPKTAMSSGVKGKVIAQAYVDKSGVVKKYLIKSAKPANLGFEDEVIKVIEKWKFTPAIQNGKPIGVWVEIPFNFEFEQ